MKKAFLPIALCLSITAYTQRYSPIPGKMMTPWAGTVTPANLWPEYPRPQFERSEWLNLNGLWDYTLQPRASEMPGKYEGSILVPFCIESLLSGVGRPMLPDDRLWYRRQFEIPASWYGRRIRLHFEAVDWHAAVWINGAYTGSHKGAYDRFSMDITDFLKERGKQEIVVGVDDPSSSASQARGKQQMPQEGIWYTPVSGIWQTVWLEPVSGEASLGEVKIIPDIDRNLVSVIPILKNPSRDDYQVTVSVFDKVSEVAQTTVLPGKQVDILLNNPKWWSPDDPFLYDMTLVLKNNRGEILDEVKSYFGMRKISLGDRNGNMVLHLNNRPLFHYGTLDQGWWPDGLHTPPSDEAMRYDIEITKKMGFNMIRKHIKVEPDRWYYWCDRLGIMVWQDMPSGMVVLPPEGDRGAESPEFVPWDGEDLNRNQEVTAHFEWEMRRMIDLHYNHPSIVIWVPFNEGWGQYATCRISEMIKSYDPTRLVNAASGWSLRACGDIYDIHSYHTEVHVPPVSREMASVVGEYGGIGFPVQGHLWNPEMRNWGYQTYHSAEELLEKYIYKFNQIVEMMRQKGLSAAVYTQTTDVEGEVNGLMTYDRKVTKMPVDTLYKLHAVLYED
ncbi:MAG: beta-galactosidase [Bacteroidales bacterium]|nr:beta-galactosidase [Bacteroidales bacterium]